MNKATIICVDDEKIVLSSIKQQLKRHFNHKFSIETVESAEDALELIFELQEDNIEIPLLISDHIMPAMKGDELIIKCEKFIPNALKILLTGQVTPEAIGNIINHANLYRYISKPWNEKDFLLTIDEAIQKYYTEQRLKEQEEQFKSIINNINIGIFCIPLMGNGNYMQINPALIKLLGYTDKNARNNSLLQHFSDASKKEYFLKKIRLKGEVKNLEVDFTTKLGDNIKVSIYASAQYDQKQANIKWINGIVENIS